MQRKAAVETAILIGVMMCQLSSIKSTGSAPPCQNNWETCMAHLCSSNQIFLQHICKVSEKKMTPQMDRQASSFHDASLPGLPRSKKGGSCLKQMSTCIQDEACNRQLVPVIQTCSSKPCTHSQCARVTQAFYRGLPTEVALGLGMCQCEPGDLDCQGVRHTLHSGSCGAEEEQGEERTCLETVDGCLEDASCRPVLEGVLSHCWSEEDRPCGASLSSVCLSLLDPSLLRGQLPSCLAALLATAGTSLRWGCTCQGLDHQGFLRCTTLHRALLNHSLHHLPALEDTGSSHPPDLVSGPQTHSWMRDRLLFILAAVLLLIAVLSGFLLLVRKLCCRKPRGAETQFHPPKKSAEVIVT